MPNQRGLAGFVSPSERCGASAAGGHTGVVVATWMDIENSARRAEALLELKALGRVAREPNDDDAD